MQELNQGRQCICRCIDYQEFSLIVNNLESGFLKLLIKRERRNPELAAARGTLAKFDDFAAPEKFAFTHFFRTSAHCFSLLSCTFAGDKSSRFLRSAFDFEMQ